MQLKALPMTNFTNQFDLPAGQAYLNTAYMGPALKNAREAGMTAINRLADPYSFKAPDFFEPPRRVRELFAKLIECDDPDRIALVPSCSYGMANAARQIKVQKHQNIVVAEGQFPSSFYVWDRLCRDTGCEMRRVAAPGTITGKSAAWNERLLETIDENTAALVIAPLDWAEGTLFDLKTLRQCTRDCGALMIVDGSQTIGAMPFSIRELQPDALACAGYKWLFCPYGSSFAYYGPYFDQGTPIEENWIIREKSEDFKNLVNYNPNYQPKALRYSSGQHPAHIHVAMQEAALTQVLEWTPALIQQHATGLFEPFQETLQELGCRFEDRASRAGHLFGFHLPEQVDIQELKSALDDAQVIVSLRGEAVRISLHLFNQPADLDRLVKCIRQQLG